MCAEIILLDDSRHWHWHWPWHWLCFSHFFHWGGGKPPQWKKTEKRSQCQCQCLESSKTYIMNCQTLRNLYNELPNLAIHSIKYCTYRCLRKKRHKSKSNQIKNQKSKSTHQLFPQALLCGFSKPHRREPTTTPSSPGRENREFGEIAADGARAWAAGVPGKLKLERKEYSTLKITTTSK